MSKDKVDNVERELHNIAHEKIEEILRQSYSGSTFQWTKNRANHFNDIDTETLLLDEYFLNAGEWLWPYHIDLVKEIIDAWVNDGVNVVMLVGGFGTGKTVIGSILQWIMHLKFSCQFDPNSQGNEVVPQRYYGLRPDTTIAFLSLSKSLKKSKEITFGEVKNSFNTQFNNDYFPVNPRIKSQLEIERNNTLIFPNTATEAANAGYSVYSAVIDEINFFDMVEDSTRTSLGDAYDQAEGSFVSTFGRMRSRFNHENKLNGMVVMFSSVNHSEDFLFRKIKEERHGLLDESDVRVFYRILKPWEVHPHKKPGPDTKYFFFDVDTMEIIDEKKEALFLESTWEHQDYDIHVFEPPEADENWNRLQEFRKDPEYTTNKYGVDLDDEEENPENKIHYSTDDVGHGGRASNDESIESVRKDD